MAREFSGYKPVGSSNRNFDPTEPVKQATFHLRHHTDLFETELLLFDDENEVEIGRKWPKDSFEAAVLILVKKVRDNLFHGRKMDLEEDKYQRNKELVTMSSKIKRLILDGLIEAENSIN